MNQRNNEQQHRRQIMEELKQACIDGDLIEVRKYMCVVKQPSFPFKDLEKPIKPLVYWAAKAGKVDVLKELIETYKCDPHYTTERGHTLLYVACARGHADVMRYLAGKYGVDPKQRNDMQSTPLFAACNNGHLEVVLLLIDELKCDPNMVNDKGETLLHRASGGGHLEVVKCLITKYNLSPEARSKYKNTPLHDACAKGHLVVVQYLIETHRCKINVFNKLSSTPLHIACRNGHSNVVHYLVVKQNCEVAPYDNSGSTPLHVACKFRRKEVVRALLDSGRVDPNLPTLAGEVPIMMVNDPDIVRYLIKSGAKPVGRIPDILKEFIKQAPLNSLVHVFMVGHSEAGKSTLAQALQMPVTSSMGGLIAQASTVANDLSRTAGIIPMEFNSPDFGRVLLYDFAGYPEYHASHGALLEHFNTSTAPLFLLVVDLNKSMDDVKRKINYWLSFIETHRISGVSPPHVMFIGSHYDLLKKKDPEMCIGFTSALESYIGSRLKQSKLCLGGFFAIDCREPKKQRDLRQCLKKNCDGLRVHHKVDSFCHVLNVFLTKEFDKQLACTIDNIIQKVRASENYPIPMQADRLCDLAEELSTQTKILFLRNKEIPEKSWIVLDIDTLLSKINGRIFAPESLPEHCLTPTHTGVLPWSQIQRHLPDLDPSLVVSFLGRLEFCQVVQDPEVLSLIKFGKSDTSSTVDSDEETGSPISSYRQSFVSQMSTSSSQTYSSGVANLTTASRLSCFTTTSSSGVSSMSNSTTGDSILSEQDAILSLPDWVANLYSPSSSPQHHASTEKSSTKTATCEQNTQIAPSPSSTSINTKALHISSVQHNINTTEPLHQLKISSQHLQPPTGVPVATNTAITPSSHHEQPPNPIIITSPSLPTPSESQASHDQLHNLNSGKATEGSQPSLPEEQTWLPGGLQFGSLHRSPSDSCTLSSGQQQHQRNVLHSQGVPRSPRMSCHMQCIQSPVLQNDKFLFFPGLVNSGQPSGEMWLKDPSFVFYSGWCLESAQSHKFFTPRFLQTLILRLAFGFAISVRPNGVLTSSLSSFSRECTIWKNGLRWLNLDSVETFVEMVEDGRALLLLMRAKKGSELRGVSLRSALIRKILNTKEEYCPSLPTSEYLIHPKHLQERESYPIITSRLDRLKRYDMNLITQAIVAEKRRTPHLFVMDTRHTNVEHLTDILHFDPYMCLNSNTLEKLFDPMNQDKELSEDLLLDFSKDYPDAASTFHEILLDGSRYHGPHSPGHGDDTPCFQVLRRYWERVPILTVSDFRHDLDRHSIFAGRNIIDLVQSQIQSLSGRSISEQTSLRKHECDASASFQGHVNRTYFCHTHKHTVKKYLYCAENIAPVPFLGQVKVLEFDSSGGEYKSNQHDITISIPRGAIPQGERVHMEVAVAPYGPFQFSDGKRPISPILWLCAQEDVVFHKPITIVLPHMLTDICNEDIDNFGIQFAKADHQDYRISPTGQTEYVFKPYKSETAPNLKSGKHYAILEANHCCFWCLEMNKQSRVTPEIARQMARKMGYFIHCVECLQSPYCSISPPRDVIHFCVSFMLDTCMKAIEDQFPLTNVHGELIHKIHTQRFNLNESHLQLTYSTDDKNLCDVAVSNEGKIYASSVDFWEEGLGQDELKLMHDRKVYPPRVEMTVQLMNHDQKYIKLSINIDGCSSERDSPKFQIFLPLGRYSEAAAVALSSTKNGIKTLKYLCGPAADWIPTQPDSSVPHKGDKPNLRQLQRLCKGCMKVTVLKNIAPKWKELAMEMGFGYSDIETVDIQTNKDPKMAVCSVIGRWLEGTVADMRPLTWSTLIECVSNIECQSLADELSCILLD